MTDLDDQSFSEPGHSWGLEGSGGFGRERPDRLALSLTLYFHVQG